MRAAGASSRACSRPRATPPTSASTCSTSTARARLIRAAGAESCYIDYHPSFGGSPFGKVICTSVNDAVLHGLPHDYRLQDGDLLSLDFAASLDGWVSDSALSIVVGTPDPKDLRAHRHHRARARRRASRQPTGRPQDRRHLGRDRRRRARPPASRVNLDFGGHGVGRTMHGDPHVPNDGRRKRGLPLRAGLVFAIEPWFMHGTDEIYTDRDGWTLRSRRRLPRAPTSSTPSRSRRTARSCSPPARADRLTATRRAGRVGPAGCARAAARGARRRSRRGCR